MNNNMPIYLSVVMSAYNDEKYIGLAIDSILNQTYPYFEFIIVNDGSTDNTLDIIRSYSDKRIRVIDKSNTGLPSSLNIGIKTAKYKWIVRMDSDDIAKPTRFENQVKYLKGGVDVVGGQCDFVNEQGKYIGRSCMPLSPKIMRLYAEFNISRIIHPTTIISRDSLMSIGGYDEYLHGAEDFDLWLRMFNSKNVIMNIRDIVLEYRINPQGISRGKNKNKQFIASVIGYIKYKNRITRCLDNDTYNRINDQLLTDNDFQKLISSNKQYVSKLGRLWNCLRQYCILNIIVKRIVV